MPDLPTLDLRPLYQGPLGDFVAARAALARRLRLAGDPRAAEVRALRKPSLSAWAVNQLFAHQAEAMAGLLATGERVRAARKVAESGGDARLVRDLLVAVGEQAAGLTRRAVELLAPGVRAPGEAIVARLRGDLDALALDPATAAVAARGWLDADLEPPGFEILAPLQLAAAGVRSTGRAVAPAPAGVGAPVEQLDDRRREVAERRERERRERLARLRAELADAESALAARRRAADEATAAAAAAAGELARTRVRAAEADDRAAEARARAADAETAAERARAALARAEDEAGA